MNKITLALVMGTGLTLGLNAPTARAGAIQTFDTPSLSAATFNKDFTPYNTAVLSPYQFDGATGPSGMIESQVFKGNDGTSFQGTYAYAYQVAANKADGNSSPSVVDSTAFQFNATPLGSDLTGAGKNSFGYVITNGQVGGLDLSGTQVPSTLSWQANDAHTKGIVRAQFVDPSLQANSLNPGSNSATFVLLAKTLPSDVKPSVNVGGGSATTTVPLAYSAAGGAVEPIPVPEPATIFAWAGMAGAFAVARRFRKARLVTA